MCLCGSRHRKKVFSAQKIVNTDQLNAINVQIQAGRGIHTPLTLRRERFCRFLRALRLIRPLRVR